MSVESIKLIKPVVRRHFADSTELGRMLRESGLVIGADHWVINFPPRGDSDNGCTWIAQTCEYVRASISAWYRDGLSGLSDLHKHRYGNVA